MKNEPNSANVSFGKPMASGGIYFAPAGTTLPTDATTALDQAFLNLGYISDDGLTNTIDTDTNQINAWGGDQVLSSQASYAESYTYNLLEVASANAAKHFWGDANVKTDSSGNITEIKHSSKELPEMVVVVEVALTGNRISRTIIPRAKIADRSGDISYTDSDPIAYPVNLSALPYDAAGTTAIEYRAKVASAASEAHGK